MIYKIEASRRATNTKGFPLRLKGVRERGRARLRDSKTRGRKLPEKTAKEKRVERDHNAPGLKRRGDG